MTRDAPEIDGILRPLASRGAPPGFAARLQARYQAAIERRQRRIAIAIALSSFAALTAVVLVLGFLAGATVPELVRDSASGLATAAGAVLRCVVLPVVARLGAYAGVLVLAAAFVAAACLGIAALVRRETEIESRVQ